MRPTTADRLTKARMSIILASPFWGALLMRLPITRDDSIPTFCTNGKSIRYNEEFAQELSDDELRGVLVHEVSHCAQGHLWRQGMRDANKWNRACDYQVNLMLTDYAAEDERAFRAKQANSARYVPPWKIPTCGLLNPQYAGKSAEDIYNLLPDDDGRDKGVNGSGISPGAFDPGEGSSSAELEAEAADWKMAVTQAATGARMQGNLPGSIERLIGELLQPKVSWREVLREFIRQKAKDDYCWARPNRRYSGHTCILPSLYSERMGRIAIAVDTSGSISAENLAEFQAEIQCALDECQPESIQVIYCDARVNGVDQFTPGDTVQLRPMGGGGTRFTPVFDYIDSDAESDEPPVCLIYLTDGLGSFPDHEPDYPVLWASTYREEYPFGQVVEIK